MLLKILNSFRRFLECAALAAALSSCAVTLPPAPANNPADPHAPEAASGALRPSLVANSRIFLSPAADDREEQAKPMDMGAHAMPESH